MSYPLRGAIGAVTARSRALNHPTLIGFCTPERGVLGSCANGIWSVVDTLPTFPGVEWVIDFPSTEVLCAPEPCGAKDLVDPKAYSRHKIADQSHKISSSESHKSSSAHDACWNYVLWSLLRQPRMQQKCPAPFSTGRKNGFSSSS